MESVLDVVSWVMKDEKIVKLKKADETYDLDDAVFTALEKNGTLDKLEDQEVEVKIDGNKITDLQVKGTVKAEVKDEPKAEAKAETPETSTDNIVKEMTVGGVSVAKRGVIFKEEEKVWYTLDDSLDVQAFKDNYTGQVVEIYIEETDKGNDVIKGFTAKEVGETKDTDEPSKNTYSNGANATQVSIEAQASVNSANRLVASMINIHDDPEKVLTTISKIAEHNFKTIQDLKK